MSLANLRNLGPKTAIWLKEIGIVGEAELRALGSVEAWQRLRVAHGPRISRVALYALEGALNDRDWRDLPPERLAELKQVIG